MLSIIKTRLADRPAQVYNLYWGLLNRLLVVIVPSDDPANNGNVDAYGLDPDHINPNIPDPIDPAAAGLVFAQVVPRDNFDDFLDLIANGKSYTPVRNPSLLFGAVADVDVSTQQPPTQGPKVKAVLAYAALFVLRAKKLTA